jgi:hypothetical protein
LVPAFIDRRPGPGVADQIWRQPVDCGWENQSMSDETEIAWHREQITRKRAELEELEAGNQDGGEVFPETQAEIDRVKLQIAQSELIVAAYEKGIGQEP